MKKIVVITAVLTTTMIFSANAKNDSKPLSSKTVVDIVAVGKRTPDIARDNTKIGATKVKSEYAAGKVRADKETGTRQNEMKKKAADNKGLAKDKMKDVNNRAQSEKKKVKNMPKTSVVHSYTE